MRDLYHNLLPAQVINPGTYTTTRTSTAIDTQGFNSALVLYAIGQCGDTLSGSLYWTLKLQHSDDDVSYADVAATDVLNSSLTVTIDSSSKDRQVYAFGYQGGKRYLKAVATPTGSHSSGTPIGILSVLGHAGYKPVN